MALLLGAAAAKAAYDYGPAIYSGLKNEAKVLKHSKKHGLAKLGQGFSSFGEGVLDSITGGEVGGYMPEPECQFAPAAVHRAIHSRQRA